MKWFLGVLMLTSTAFAAEWTLVHSYGSHNAVCTQTAVGSTNANRATMTTPGLYEVYGYTSSTDFTGVAIKCLQGGASVTVNAVEGTKIPAGAHVQWRFDAGSLSISCQTGSGSGFYDVCPLN
jgi:hypothetical protein